MTHSRRHPRTCKVCGRGKHDGVDVSASGLCAEHGLERYAENFLAMKTKRGPYARWWAARLAAGVGLGPLDDMPPRP